MSHSVIIRTEERRCVQLGGLWFYHSTLRRELFVPLENILLTEASFVTVKLGKTLPVVLRYNEIKEIQFV